MAKRNSIKKTRGEGIAKYGGHCYDSMGWTTCKFWVEKEGRHYCKLFGMAEKTASYSLNACNHIYGEIYEGDA